MVLHITCANGNCAKRVRVRDELAGRHISCPLCGTRQVVTGLRRPAPPIEVDLVPPEAGRVGTWLLGGIVCLIVGGMGLWLLVLRRP